ncbi:hypothetical protein BJ508DRAFT_419024 [Ascobolus immersus RN42]|uniref:Conserved oligomeric Golgi complex subunit 2 n=1 Tax=Ascobolus immersus RN42 TaxID=1160509 RepID=A0A3N4HKT0_ASCIM|nr:hypothetical protein BJ508DRAFT_419024 [Ascobolus immersus RN42]
MSFFGFRSNPAPPPPNQQPSPSHYDAAPITIPRPPSSAASSEADDTHNPLSRTHFQPATAPDFDPLEFLNTLSSHTTISLPKLQQDLTQRSQSIESELLELVNRDYGDFVGLGTSLAGGEGKVEDLRLGLLGFRRKVEGSKAEVESLMGELDQSVKEMRSVLKEKEEVRRLIDIDRRLSELEQWGKSGYEEEEGLEGLREAVDKWCVIEVLVGKCKKGDEFVKSLASRRVKTRERIVKKLGDLLWEVRKEGNDGGLLEVLGLFDAMEEREEPARVLRDFKMTQKYAK